MRIHSSLSDSSRKLTGGALAIGNFDGVHLGHQALFAAAAHSPKCALTFEPHPAKILAPRYAPPLICVPERKRELLASCGVSELIEQPFDLEFAKTEPQRFVEMLVDTGIAEVVVGADFTYGRQRKGSVESLRLGLEERGVKLRVVPPVTVAGLVCSSTKVREFVLEGRVDAARMLLGRNFDLAGDVVQGAGRGRKIGVPTANLRTANELLPAIGVYAVRASVGGESAKGAANLGLNPTFGGGSLSLEVHLLDFDRDIYGQRVRVEFVERLRAERRFHDVEALKEQIAQDIASARRILEP
jgi:riboflavin kinase/FMN adenylyltransferase